MIKRCACGKFIGKDQKRCDKCHNKFLDDVVYSDTYTTADVVLPQEDIDIEDIKDKVVGDFIETGDGNAVGIAISPNRPYSLEEIIEMWSIDTKKWEPMAPLKANCWPTTNGEGKSFMNYQTKVNFRPKQRIYDYDLMRDDFKKFAQYWSPKKWEPIAFDFKEQEENNLLEINTADLHIGKLCWAGETDENYDVNIACERFMDVLQKIFKRVRGFDFNQIVLPLGNDFFNSDNLNNTTTKGTPQDEDLRWGKVYPIARRLLVEAINFCSQFAPTHVIIIQGNHDFQRMFYVGDTLEALFENNPNVTVNNSSKRRKYHKYGDVLLGFTHGSEEKEANLPLIMAQECPKLWGETKFREMHLGHLHHRKEIKYQSTKEYSGVVVRYMRSLAGTDEWHYGKGYVGNIKGSEAYLWNDEAGLIGSFEVNLNI